MNFIYSTAIFLLCFLAFHVFQAFEKYSEAQEKLTQATYHLNSARLEFDKQDVVFLDWKEKSSDFSARYLSPFQKQMLSLQKEKDAGRE